MTAQARVSLGRVSGVHGVRGWLKVYSYTRPIDNVLDYPRWFIGGEPFELDQGRAHGPGLIALMKGLADRDAAAALIGKDIEVLRSELPALDEGEVYWADLIGLRVVGLEDEAFGQIAGLMETGANDVMVVDVGGLEELIPYVRGPVVTDIDLEAGVVTVNWASAYWAD